MAGLHHGPAHPAEEEHEHIVARNTRYGLVLFAVYLALYAGYMALVAFWPQALRWMPWHGINLAVLYGFGLIAAALVLALVYSWLCRARATGEPEDGP